MLSPSEHSTDRAAVPVGLHSEPLARLAEANHRIANNLSLIVSLVRIQADGFAARRLPVSPQEVCGLLDEIACRVDAVGQLHRLLSTDVTRSTVDLAEYLTQVCAAVGGVMPAGQVPRLRTTFLAGCRLRPDQVLPLALIVSEAVTNAVKYAHPAGVAGRIDVTCRREPDGRLLVEIADDGVGLPDDFDLAHDGGLGLQVIRALSRQLGAELTLESAGLGLAVQVRLPPAAHTAL